MASQVIDGIQKGVAERGSTDVRPAHGFAFVRIAAGELPEPGHTPAHLELPERIELGGWLSEMIRSGEWAHMVAEITAEDPELADDSPAR